MSSIQRLGQGAFTSASQIPFNDPTNGVDRRSSVSQLIDVMKDGFVPDGGILAMSGFYNLRKAPAAPLAVNVGTAYANFANYDAPLVFPFGRDSIAPMAVLGEFVATRDLAGVMFWAAMTGTWPTNRDLTLAVLVGTDAVPFESSFQFIGAGRGAGALISASFSGPTVNLNNPDGVIKAGEKIRLVAKMNVADVLTLSRLSFVAQTLDGV